MVYQFLLVRTVNTQHMKRFSVFLALPSATIRIMAARRMVVRAAGGTGGPGRLAWATRPGLAAAAAARGASSSIAPARPAFDTPSPCTPCPTAWRCNPPHSFRLQVDDDGNEDGDDDDELELAAAGGGHTVAGGAATTKEGGGDAGCEEGGGSGREKGGEKGKSVRMAAGGDDGAR
jgi:hypothetical protein